MKANARSAEVRREKAAIRRRTPLDWLAAKFEERAEELVDAAIAAGLMGDWRATEMLFSRVYGRPQERVDVSSSEDPLGVRALSLEQRLELRARLLAENPELATMVSDMVNGKVVEIRRPADGVEVA